MLAIKYFSVPQLLLIDGYNSNHSYKPELQSFECLVSKIFQ